MLLTEIAQSKSLKVAALLITVAAGSITIYHMYHQIQLTKLNLKKARREEKTAA